MGTRLSFDHPWFWLILPLAVAIFWLLARRSNAPLAADQVRQSLILRSFATFLIAGALAGPILTFDSQNQTVMFLVDISKSISPAARAREFEIVRRAFSSKPRHDLAGMISFASSPVLTVQPSNAPQMPENSVPVDDSSTDLSAAVRLAKASMPANGPRQIVILSDGNETIGSAQNEVSGGDISVSAVDPQEFLGAAQPEASIASVSVPPQTRENQPAPVTIVVASSSQQQAKLTLTGELQPTSFAVTLNPGKNSFTFPVKFAGSGLRRIDASLDAPNDTLLENNVGSAMTWVTGKPRILYLTDNPTKVAPTLQRAMAAQSIDLDLVSPLQAPKDVAGFSSYDSVVLGNITTGELTTDQQNALQIATRDFGVGLGMVGGPQSFIGGGWQGTPIEASLPVLMQPRAGTKAPAADIVIVLDQSNSMSIEENGVEKVKLGALAAVSLMSSLQPQDRVAVVAVTETPTIVVPFSSRKDALAAKNDVEGLEAGGGGIYCLAGLEAAYTMLETSSAPIKHVIICPDTNDSEQQDDCVSLAQTMRVNEKITTSVCGIGDWHDRDVGFQQNLAASGGGQLYIVNQASDLPQFFQRDLTHFQTPPFVEGNFRANISSSDRVISGLSQSTEPALLGYDIVTARPGATVPIRSAARPDPILAYEKYGLGHTFCFMSDETDHWAKNWLGWTGYSQMWSQILRWSLRGSKPADFQAFAVSDSPGTFKVVVDSFQPDGSYLNGANFIASAAGASGATKHLSFAQTAPGRYEASFRADELGSYLISVSKTGETGSSALLGVAQSYPAEYAQVGPNLPLLSTLSSWTGGKILEDGADVWKFRPGAVNSELGIAAVYLLIGLCVFILDIAWRRLGLRLRSKTITAPVAAYAGRAALAVATSARSAAIALPAKVESRKVERKQKTADDDSAFLSRPLSHHLPEDDDGYDNPFPLVVSLDEVRRRQNQKRE